MIIYNSTILSIDKRDNILVSEWSGKKITLEIFQQELKKFLSFSKKVQPYSVLWLQEKFSLEIPHELNFWIQEDIVKPQYQLGLRKIAFTIPKNIYAHLSIINSFNKSNQLIYPTYFKEEKKAFDFCEERPLIDKSNPLDINIKSNKKLTSIQIDIKTQELPYTLRYIDRLKQQFEFKQTNLEKFKLLTSREVEIFYFICNGLHNKEIASQIHISKDTVGVHRKNIIRKLEIKNKIDWQNYIDAFS